MTVLPEQMKKSAESEHCCVRKDTHPNDTENGNKLSEIIANKEIVRNVYSASENVHLKANDKIIQN